jgi:hypothetical protein
MRRTQLLIFFVVFAGFCVAQDTEFPVGPQYLITTSSSMLLHPIATPSLSLGEAPPATPAASAVETPSYENSSCVCAKRNVSGRGLLGRTQAQ